MYIIKCDNLKVLYYEVLTPKRLILTANTKSVNRPSPNIVMSLFHSRQGNKASICTIIKCQ